MPKANKPEETEEQKQARISARLAELGKRDEQLKQQAEDIEAEREQLKAEAAELLENKLGLHTHNGGAVRLSPNRRWDDDTAREVLGKISPDILKAITITKLDSRKAKEMLPPATYKQCMKDGDRPKVQFQ